MKSKRDLLPRDYPPPRSPLCPFVLLHARKIRVKYYNACNTRFTITRLRSLNLIINSRIIENVKKLIKSWWKYNYTTVYLIREMNIYLIIERKKLLKKYNGIFCIRFLIFFFFFWSNIESVITSSIKISIRLTRKVRTKMIAISVES